MSSQAPRHDGPADPAPPRGPRPSPAVYARRRLLVGGIGAAVLAGAAAATQLRRGDDTSQAAPVPQQRATCADPSTLTSTNTLGGARLIYDISGRQEAMQFEPGFLSQVTAWLADWNATSRYTGVQDIWGYGAYVPKDDCRSWHAAGRAFDISRLRAGDRLLVSCRTDLWPEVSAQQQRTLARGYWALAASLHLHFAYVLTHHFDDLHRNHIHVDNGVSGSGMSRFATDSQVQSQAVQAICATLWNRPGDVTGVWADARRQVQPVLDELGISDLTRVATWQTFLRASVARG